jgi:hypothetical protein
MRIWAVALLAVAFGGTASSPSVDLQEPLPFDHGGHARTFEKAGLDCVSCHPVGARPATPEPGVPAPELSSPRSACHGCHLGTAPDAPRRAKSACTGCHASLTGLLPGDHNALWPLHHADAARDRHADCTDCHQGRWCVECHLDRGPMSQSPHGTGFRITHGIEARVDPARCTSCHVGSMCTSCHTTGVLPW